MSSIFYNFDPEVDGALAMAWQDTFTLRNTLEGYEPDGTATLRIVSAARMVAQWVELAADKRGFKLHAKVGERVPFDPAVYDMPNVLYGTVEVVKPAVVLYVKDTMFVIAKGLTRR